MGALPDWILLDGELEPLRLTCALCDGSAELPDTPGRREAALALFLTEHAHDGDVSVADQWTRAAAFRALFDGTFEAWEFAGTLRRRKPGRQMVHVVRPRLVLEPGNPAAGDGVPPEIDLVFRRVLELVEARELTVTVASITPGELHWFALMCRGRVHNLAEASAGGWGVAVAKHTGPPPYWALLKKRLRSAGVLDVQEVGREGLLAGWVDRGAHPPAFHPLDCPDEEAFFRLARTRHSRPEDRYQASGRADWRLGMLQPWYPPDVPHACRGKPAHLWTPEKPKPAAAGGGQ